MNFSSFFSSPDAMKTFNKVINSTSKELLCGPGSQCAIDKESNNLEQKYIESQNNVDTAPQQLLESEKNYYLYSQGQKGYNQFLNTKYTSEADTVVKDITDIFNLELQKVMQMNNTLKSLTVNYENEKERERLKYDVTFIPASNIKMIDADTLINVYSEYIEWEFPGLYTKLACSQALGHNSITGYDPEYKVIQLTENDKFKVILGSDGLWEMIMKDDIQDVNNLYNMEANAIVEQTTNRWLQMWNMHDVLNNKKNVQGKFTPHQCDDIAVFIADILPNEINEMANENENENGI
jgi:hypothetical protein